MPTRPSKRTILDELEETNSLAAHIVEQATREPATAPTKNPAAVALGRLGASKGGKARAKSLTTKRKIEIAKAAAKTRWSKNTIVNKV